MRGPREYLGQYGSKHAMPSGQEERITEPPRGQHHLIEHNLFIYEIKSL